MLKSFNNTIILAACLGLAPVLAQAAVNCVGDNAPGCYQPFDGVVALHLIGAGTGGALAASEAKRSETTLAAAAKKAGLTEGDYIFYDGPYTELPTNGAQRVFLDTLAAPGDETFVFWTYGGVSQKVYGKKLVDGLRLITAPGDTYVFHCDPGLLCATIVDELKGKGIPAELGADKQSFRIKK